MDGGVSTFVDHFRYVCFNNDGPETLAPTRESIESRVVEYFGRDERPRPSDSTSDRRRLATDISSCESRSLSSGFRYQFDDLLTRKCWASVPTSTHHLFVGHESINDCLLHALDDRFKERVHGAPRHELQFI